MQSTQAERQALFSGRGQLYPPQEWCEDSHSNVKGDQVQSWLLGKTNSRQQALTWRSPHPPDQDGQNPSPGPKGPASEGLR